jgi:hypothetical protein
LPSAARSLQPAARSLDRAFWETDAPRGLATECAAWLRLMASLVHAPARDVSIELCPFSDLVSLSTVDKCRMMFRRAWQDATRRLTHKERQMWMARLREEIDAAAAKRKESKSMPLLEMGPRGDAARRRAIEKRQRREACKIEAFYASPGWTSLCDCESFDAEA